MTVYLIVLVTLLTHTSFKGSKMLIALFAIDLGANPFAIGILFAMYSVFPVFLSVYAGKVSDRVGFRLPMLAGSAGLLAGLMLPYFVPRIPALYVSATLIGLCYIFYIVAVQHLVGSMGEGHERTRNYSIFSMGVGLTALLGPTATGFAIDGIGHRATYLMLAAFPALPVIALIFLGRMLPRPHFAATERHAHRVTDLLGIAPLRRVLVTAGILETGMEMFNFLTPIYGHSIGLSASRIGVVMGGFALAMLLVRTAMPALARRSGEERVLSASLLIATAAYLAFPFVTGFVPLLAVAFALGLGLGCGAPISMTLAYNRSPQGRSGEAIGLRQTVNKATEVAVPIIFGSLSTAAGMIPVFWSAALMLASGSVLMHRDARVKAKGVTSER